LRRLDSGGSILESEACNFGAPCDPEQVATRPNFDDLMVLLKLGRAYVKIYAPYRTSEKSPDFPDMAPLARLLVAANPDRILWGSNWPYPGRGPTPSAIAPPYPNDDGRVLNLLLTWVPDPAIRKKILADNPTRLNRFEVA